MTAVGLLCVGAGCGLLLLLVRLTKALVSRSAGITQSRRGHVPPWRPGHKPIRLAADPEDRAEQRERAREVLRAKGLSETEIGRRLREFEAFTHVIAGFYRPAIREEERNGRQRGSTQP